MHEVSAVGVGRVRNAGGLAAEPHSMDRRLHNVVRRDVVVPWQWQPGGLHRDPATVIMLYTPTLHKPLISSYKVNSIISGGYNVVSPKSQISKETWYIIYDSYIILLDCGNGAFTGFHKVSKLK